MSFDLSEFDFSQVESSTFDLLPVGKYVAHITQIDKKATKAGTGHYLNLRVDILDGKYKGRVIFTMLNLWNPNPKAVEMSQRDMKAIMDAVGASQPLRDTGVIMNKALGIQVGVRHSDYKGEEENYIKGWLSAGKVPVEGSQPSQPQGGTGAAPAPWAN